MWNWFFEKAMPWFRELLQQALNVVCPILFAGLRISVACWGIVLGIWALITWAWSTVFTMIQDILLQQLPTLQGQLVVYWTFINRLVPLSEGVAMSIIIFNVWVSVVVIRWFKSIIPTISN